MKVLSLFDSMSCGQIALNELGIIPEMYLAAEIKPHAIKVTQTNFPNTIQLGDVREIEFDGGQIVSQNGKFNVGNIDLLIGGSPCQDLSDDLCLYCPLDDDEKGTHGVPNGYISCEGRCCQEAYEMYIEEWTE